MHEFSLVKSLLDQVDTLRRENAAERVLSISVSIGEFSGVEPELFRYAYETLVTETPARDAELQLNCVALQSTCDDCGHEFAVTRYRFHCPKCGGGRVTVIRGQELVLESVTLEHDE